MNEFPAVFQGVHHGRGKEERERGKRVFVSQVWIVGDLGSSPCGMLVSWLVFLFPVLRTGTELVG